MDSIIIEDEYKLYYQKPIGKGKWYEIATYKSLESIMQVFDLFVNENNPHGYRVVKVHYQVVAQSIKEEE